MNLVNHRLGFLATFEEFMHQCSPEDQAQFAELWQAHLECVAEGASGYFVPGNMGTAFEEMLLLSQAAYRMAEYFGESMVLAFDEARNIYFVGSARSARYNEHDILKRFPRVNNLWQHIDGLLDQNRNVRGVADYPHQGNINNRVLPVPVEPHAVDINNIPAQHDDGGRFGNAIQDAEPAVEDAELGVLPAQANDKKIPKPRNSWIFYRSDKHKEIAVQHPAMHTSQISKLISDMWKNESREVKDQYKARAEEEKLMYRNLYPDYKCAPRKSADIKKRKSAKAQPNMNDEGQAQPAAAPPNPAINHDYNGRNLYGNHLNEINGGLEDFHGQIRAEQEQRRIEAEAQQQEAARLDEINRGLEDFHDQIRVAQEQRHIAEEAARLDEINRGLEDWHAQIRAAQEQRRIAEEAARLDEINRGLEDWHAQIRAAQEQRVNPFEQNQQLAAVNPDVAIAPENHEQLDPFEQFIDFNQGAAVEAQEVAARVDEVAADNLNIAIERHARLLRQLQDQFRDEIEGLGVEFPVAYAQLENAAANL